MDIFVINGYCIAAELEVIKSEKDKLVMALQLKLPANLWSIQVLQGMKVG